MNAQSQTDDDNRTISTSGGAYGEGNVHAGRDFIGHDKHVHGDEVQGDKVMGDKYVLDNLEDTPLSAEELHTLLDRYRQRLLEETRYVKLEGIPLPDADIAIPLQRVYIHIQALEQRESQTLRRAEEQALLEEASDARKKRHRTDLFDLISRLGEYLYRRGESAESSERPVPIDPLDAVRKH